MTLGDAVRTSTGCVVKIKGRVSRRAVVMDKIMTAVDGKKYFDFLCDDGMTAEWFGYRQLVIDPVQDREFVDFIRNGLVWKEWGIYA